jgi:hypothetical protein
MHWDDVVSKFRPYIVRIETPVASGTGFLCFYNIDKTVCGVATALHVVRYADEWRQPIKIIHHDTGRTIFLTGEERVIFANWDADSAAIMFNKGDLPFPEQPAPLLPIDVPISIGNEVCWLGFPAIAPYTLCFFSGTISARREEQKSYLIDGVVINGVSGGPVLYCTQPAEVQIVGIITAYRANRLGTEALPGLSVAQDVSHFHHVIQQVRSIEEAQRKKEEDQRDTTTDENSTGNR